jgi:hypothetical protein
MAELVRMFRGKVDLVDPMCSTYILERLRSLCRDDALDEYDNAGAVKKVGGGGGICVGGKAGDKVNKLLARVVARGPKTSIYSPKTCICITRMPLCSIASFLLCNIA